MIPVNFHHLYYFYMIARTGSVSRAAQELRLAQPTLSAQLKQFEHYLDRRLFEREGRKLILTEDGHFVLSYANTIFDIGQELMDGLGDKPKKGGYRIQLGASVSTPRAVIDALLKFLLKQKADSYLNVQIGRAEELLQRLEDHSLDLVLMDVSVQPSAQSGVERRTAFSAPVVFCASAALARKHSRFPKDLHGAPMILPTTHSGIYHSLKDYFKEQKVEPRIIAEIQDLELVRRLALAGMGIAPLNQFTALNAPAKEKLVILDRNTKHPIQESLYFYYKKRKRPHPFLEEILKSFKL